MEEQEKARVNENLHDIALGFGRIMDQAKDRAEVRTQTAASIELIQSMCHKKIADMLSKEFSSCVEKAIATGYPAWAGWSEHEFQNYMSSTFQENYTKILSAVEHDDVLPGLEFLITFPAGMVAIERQILDLWTGDQRPERKLLADIKTDPRRVPQIFVGVSTRPHFSTHTDLRPLDNEGLLAVVRSKNPAAKNCRIWMRNMSEEMSHTILSVTEVSLVNSIDYHGEQYCIAATNSPTAFFCRLVL